MDKIKVIVNGEPTEFVLEDGHTLQIKVVDEFVIYTISPSDSNIIKIVKGA